MKLNRSDDYLSLVLGALESTLVPELTSGAAKATAEIIKAVLVELHKRERHTPRILAEHVAQGRTLADRMERFLAELGGPAADGGVAASVVGAFQPLADVHGHLTEHIVRLADALAARRGAADAAQGTQLSALLREAADWERAYYAAQRGAKGPAPAAPVADRGGAPLTRESLEAFLRTRHPDGARCSVASLEPLPGGFSKQTYRASIVDGGGDAQPVIVRKSTATPMITHGVFLIDQEFQLLKDVFAAGMPVAEPLYLGTGVPGIDGDFYVMKALPGAVPGTYLGGASGVIPESVLLHMAELLARLHILKLDAFSGYLSRYGQVDPRRETVESCYRRYVADWRAYYRREQHLPSPYLTYLFDWLDQNVPRVARPPVLLHGDFNIHNVLADGKRVTGMLDWECAMFGSPEQDLGWMQTHVARYIDWNRFMRRYHECGGPEVDPAAMKFYMAFSSMRVFVAMNKALFNLQTGAESAIRYAMVELGFVLEFLNMGLGLTSSGGEPAVAAG